MKQSMAQCMHERCNAGGVFSVRPMWVQLHEDSPLRPGRFPGGPRRWWMFFDGSVIDIARESSRVVPQEEVAPVLETLRAARRAYLEA